MGLAKSMENLSLLNQKSEGLCDAAAFKADITSVTDRRELLKCKYGSLDVCLCVHAGLANPNANVEHE